MMAPVSGVRRFRCRLLLISFLLLLGVPGFARAQTGSYADLGDRLERKIAEFDWAGGEVGAMVVDFRHGITVFTRNPDKAVRPGPVTKLVTASAALESLGPEFQFRTELFVRGDASKGRLMGDVMIRGDGDPTITTRGGLERKGVSSLLDRWTSLLKKEGISRIEGSLWVDASLFDAVPYAAGWPVDPIVSPVLPEVSALNLNDNCLEVFWKPGKKKNTIAEFETYPPVNDYVYFSNNVRLDPAGTNARRYFRRPGVTTLAVEGTLPLNQPAHDRVTVPDPALFFGHVLKTRLGEGGIELVGPVANWKKADLAIQESRALRRLDLRRSPPLREMLPLMLAEDRTLDAEVLFKTLGRRHSGDIGTFENASQAISGVFRQWGISTSGVVFMDGSGLSSFNRISPRRMMGVLEAGHRASWQKFFNPAVPRISLDAVLQPLADGNAKSPASEPVVYGMAGPFEGGYGAAGWVETQGRSKLHFVLMLEGTRVPPALISAQIGVLIREIADTRIP